MSKVIAWFAENRVAANLLMVVILILGTTSIPKIKKEILPNVAWNSLTVSVAYPGASATEIEQTLVPKVEPLLADIIGVSRVETILKKNAALFSLQVDTFAHEKIDEIEEKVKKQLKKVRGLPAGASKPELKTVEIRDQVGVLAIYGDANERALKVIAESVRQDLLSGGLVTSIERSNAKAYQINIEVDELAMQRYGVLFPELAKAIRARAQTITSGVLDEADGQISILTKTPVSTKEDIEDIYVRSFSDGARIQVRDLAKVHDGFSDKRKNVSKFNGWPAVYLKVFRTGNQSIMQVSEALYDYIERPNVFIPESVSLAVWQDFSRYFISRVDLLVENASMGLMILCGILLVFLNLRLSFWVGVGIPTAFLGAFAVLLYADASINMISLFAFILVLGIVVDDAVIVGENIYSHQQKQGSRLKGAISGALEVANPVIFAVLTTIVMFVPMLFLPGAEGQMIKAIPVVVIAILVFSLIESLLILPAHLSSQPYQDQEDGKEVKPGFLSRIHAKFGEGFDWFVQTKVRRFFETVLAWRYASQAFFIGLFCISLALFFGGWLKMAFFSEIEADFSVANLEMPAGTPSHEVDAALKQVEKAAFKLQASLRVEDGMEQIQNIVTKYSANGRSGSVWIELELNEDRESDGHSLNKRWSEFVGQIPSAATLEFDSTLNKPGPAIDLNLTSNNTESITRATADLRALLASIDGVYNIKEGVDGQRQEIHVVAKPVAADLGINMDEIAVQVQQAFFGVDVMELVRGDEAVKVSLRYPEEDRKSLWSLENMQVVLPSGALVPLSNIAEIGYVTGPSVIRRTNGFRSVRVTAHVDEDVVSSEQVMREVRKDFLDQLDSEYLGVNWLPAGVQKVRGQFISQLLYLYTIALVVMYSIMAVLFRSYFQPLLVMYAVPFGLLGAVLGHMLMGLEVTLWSLIGMCAVSGIVVNDNLVLVDYMNRLMRSGVSVKDAIIEASVSRFRPIILTTLTTFFGLVPLMMEKSVQAKFLVPMTVSLGFGVVFATLVTLVLVPATYSIFADFKRIFGPPERSESKAQKAMVLQAE